MRKKQRVLCDALKTNAEIEYNGMLQFEVFSVYFTLGLASYVKPTCFPHNLLALVDRASAHSEDENSRKEKNKMRDGRLFGH